MRRALGCLSGCWRLSQSLQIAPHSRQIDTSVRVEQSADVLQTLVEERASRIGRRRGANNASHLLGHAIAFTCVHSHL